MNLQQLQYNSNYSDVNVSHSKGDSVALVKISGVVKWFDPVKGFGFITPDDGNADVLLHITCLNRDGYETVFEGSYIVVEAIERNEARQAFRIISIDTKNVIEHDLDNISETKCNIDLPLSNYKSSWQPKTEKELIADSKKLLLKMKSILSV